MGILCTLDSVGLEWPTRRVLDDVSLGVYEGDRIGVVGTNGAGKSSLLRLLSGEIEPTEGRWVPRRGIRIGMLGQADALDDEATVRENLFGDLPEFAWAAKAGVRSILSALLADVGLERRVAELSGGERRRVDLARLLVGEWDLLLLDEPTNHLDVVGITWLAEHLQNRWPTGEGALVVVTHDRWFLDTVCTSMWELHSGRIERFEGGFSAYTQQRVERDRQARKAEVKRQNALRRELAWLARAPQARATRPKFRKQEAEALIADVPELRDPIRLRSAAVARLGKQVFELEDVAKSYGDRVIFEGVDWIIGPGDRIGLLGENGAGKTTFLDVLSGVDEPSKGTIKRGKSVRLARVSQHLDLLAGRDEQTVDRLLEDFKRHLVMGGEEVTSRSVVESLGFSGGDFLTRLGDLSGGQRRRLAIACALMQEPNVLILDEPGNDLDVDMLAALESVLDGFSGTLLIVTHDRYLMERATDDVYALMDGRIRHLPGGVDEFLRRVEERSGAQDAPADADPSEGACAAERAVDERELRRRQNAERRAARHAFDVAGRRVKRTRDEVASLKERLASADPTDYVALQELQTALNEATARLAELEDEWLVAALEIGEDVD